MAEYDKNFSFRMPEDLRETIESIRTVEDRSLSKTLIYLAWAGIERFYKEGRLLTPAEVKTLSGAYRKLPKAEVDNQENFLQQALEEARQKLKEATTEEFRAALDLQIQEMEARIERAKAEKKRA